MAHDPFFGRRQELEVLEGLYRSTRTEMVPVYGRRRVGKSELLLHFIADKPALYFLGKKATPQLQLREFLTEAATTFQQPLLADLSVAGWQEAFTRVLEQKKGSQKIVLVLDEFQWMVQASPELPSLLQDFLDREWKKRRDLLLILCGSYMGFMEREILGEKSPLFGRRTAQILLKPFSYREAASFHPTWSWPDKARVHFICGGIPFYLLHFREKKSFFKNLEENFFDEFAPLFREVDFLLREELRELQNYYAILMSLAAGTNTGKGLSLQTGIDERKLHYYVQNLVELGYVRRRFPLTAKRPTVREVRLDLGDPLLRFWFRFVYPHTAYIARVGAGEAFQTLARPFLDSYFGKCFEDLCREALPFLYQKEGTHSVFEVGEYWDQRTQIDVVGYRKGEMIDLAECKWGKVSSIKKVTQELKEKMKLYPNPEGLTLKGRIFSQGCLPEAGDGIETNSLEDLYGPTPHTRSRKEVN